MKDLKDKAIDIKGKKYVLVSDRVLYFNEEYENGGIETKIVSNPQDENIKIKAIITPDFEKPERKFVGHSQATVGEGMVNKTAALENAETSAVGRALAMMGIGVIESIASADEMNKATYSKPKTAEDMVCSSCGSKALISPKSGKEYCPKWKLHNEEKEKYDIVSGTVKEFDDSMSEEK